MGVSWCSKCSSYFCTCKKDSARSRVDEYFENLKKQKAEVSRRIREEQPVCWRCKGMGSVPDPFMGSCSCPTCCGGRLSW